MKDRHNPILKAVYSAIGFPTVESLLLDGHTVNFGELQDTVGNRLIIKKKKLCLSHVKGLANSIIKYKAVIIPLMVEYIDGHYFLIDGYHRLAALKMIIENHPSLDISTKIKLKI